MAVNILQNIKVNMSFKLCGVTYLSPLYTFARFRVVNEQTPLKLIMTTERIDTYLLHPQVRCHDLVFQILKQKRYISRSTNPRPENNIRKIALSFSLVK